VLSCNLTCSLFSSKPYHPNLIPNWRSGCCCLCAGQCTSEYDAIKWVAVQWCDPPAVSAIPLSTTCALSTNALQCGNHSPVECYLLHLCVCCLQIYADVCVLPPPSASSNSAISSSSSSRSYRGALLGDVHPRRRVTGGWLTAPLHVHNSWLDASFCWPGWLSLSVWSTTALIDNCRTWGPHGITASAPC